MAVIGIDVGGTKVYAALATGSTPEGVSVLDFAHFTTPATLQEFAGEITQVMDRFRRATDQPVTGLGVGIPGAVRRNGTCWVPNVPWLTDCDLAAQLEQVVGVPTFVENDAQLALLAEWKLGAVRGANDALLVSVGTGVGGAILMNGQICRGQNGTAGAFGWLVLDAHAEHKTCESLASGTALNRIAQGNDAEPTSHGVIRGVRCGDPAAVQQFSEWARNLGLAICSLASIFDPEVIVISGGLSKEFELFSPMIAEMARQYASPMAQSVRILPATWSDRAALYGAMLLADLGALQGGTL